jgi:hypothetical protein
MEERVAVIHVLSALQALGAFRRESERPDGGHFAAKARPLESQTAAGRRPGRSQSAAERQP